MRNVLGKGAELNKAIMTSIEVRRFKYSCDVILYGAQSSRPIISQRRTRGVTCNGIISTAGGNWNGQIEVRPVVVCQKSN